MTALGRVGWLIEFFSYETLENGISKDIPC